MIVMLLFDPLQSSTFCRFLWRQRTVHRSPSWLFWERCAGQSRQSPSPLEKKRQFILNNRVICFLPKMPQNAADFLSQVVGEWKRMMKGSLEKTSVSLAPSPSSLGYWYCSLTFSTLSLEMFGGKEGMKDVTLSLIFTIKCHICRQLPVNVHILLFVRLPPQPLAFHIRICVGSVKTVKCKVGFSLYQFCIRSSHTYNFFFPKKSVPIEIFNQSLDGFSFRVPDLLNKTQVAPRENLGNQKKGETSALRGALHY